MDCVISHDVGQPERVHCTIGSLGTFIVIVMILLSFNLIIVALHISIILTRSYRRRDRIPMGLLDDVGE